LWASAKVQNRSTDRKNPSQHVGFHEVSDHNKGGYMTQKSTILTDKIGVDFMDHARLLHSLYEDDPAEFGKVAEGLGIGQRKAYYLVEIGRAFQGIPVTREQAMAIGWTKLQLISSRINQKNCKLLLAQAELYPVHELKEILEGKSPLSEKRCVLIYFTEEQYDRFANVLVLYGAKRKGRTLRFKEEAILAALSKLHPDA